MSFITPKEDPFGAADGDWQTLASSFAFGGHRWFYPRALQLPSGRILCTLRCQRSPQGDMWSELYYSDDDLLPGDLCPIHKTPVEEFEEENYFFRLSRFGDRLLDWYTAHPRAIVPEFRGNEALGLIRSGLRDFSISRTSLTWGIPLP